VCSKLQPHLLPNPSPRWYPSLVTPDAVQSSGYDFAWQLRVVSATVRLPAAERRYPPGYSCLLAADTVAHCSCRLQSLELRLRDPADLQVLSKVTGALVDLTATG